MLKVFPISLVGTTKRWFKRTPDEAVGTWDGLKQTFIRRFCPPSVIFKRLGEIHNFRQDEGESLYQAWERYNDLLFNCPSHDLNECQKVNTFYNGLAYHTRRTLDSQGLIPGLTATKALESIQKMADHSHKWHNKESDKNLTLLIMIAEKLRSLNRDMGSLKENVRKIHNGPQCEELKTMRIIKNNNVGFTKNTMPKLGLRETFEHYLHESYKRQEGLDGWIKLFVQKTNQDLIRHNVAIKSLEERVTCLAHTISINQANQTPINHPASDSAKSIRQECAMKFELSHDIPFTKVETFAEKVRRIIEENENREKILRNLESEPVNTPLVNAIRKTLDYTRRLQELVSNKTKIEEVYMVKINARCSAVLQNELPPMEKDPGSFILPCAIGNTTVSNALATWEQALA
ncbi:homeodomain-like protein [Tanacetum coccineum]